MAWYAIQTIVKKEREAAINLHQRNYYSYCPLVPSDTRNGKTGTEPAFPGYVFVSLTEGQDDFHPIKHTPGVMRLVSLSRIDDYLHPTPLPDGIIEAIMANENRGFGQKTSYTKGDKVRFKSGPFTDYEAEIAEIMQKGGQERAILLLSYAEKAVRLEAKTADIQPVN